MRDVVTLNNSCFVCHFHVDPNQREQFVAAFEAMWRDAHDFMNEQCNFVFYGWGRDPNEYVAIESYKDEVMLAGLRASETFQKVVGDLLAYCSRSMVLDIYSGAEMDRSVFDAYPAGPSKVHPKNGEVGAIFS